MKLGVLRLLAAVAAVLLVAVAAGCGSSSDETTVVLSHAQFVKEGNAICKEQREKRNKILAKAIEGKDQSKLQPAPEREEIVLRILPYYAEIPQKLEALGVPKGDEKEVKAIGAAIDQAVKSVEADPLKALETTSQFYKASKLSAEFGLNECVV